MAGRRDQRCNGCGLQLVAPPEAQAVRCGACKTVTNLRPANTWGQLAYGTVGTVVHVGGRFKDIVKGAAVGAVTSYKSSSPKSCGNNNIYQMEPPPLAVLPPPPAHGRKKAVLCGVNYRKKSYALKGSADDVKCMKYALVEKLGFPKDCIITLTEDEANPLRIPTKQNIRLAMRWLVQDCKPGDSLVFHFAGHGARQKDYNNDELDGFDETLCPLDYETEGSIIDDEINATIVRPLPHGATLHAIIDSCYSGTVLDLQFLCKMNKEGQYMWEDQRCPTACYKGTSGGLALCLSACDDHQTSADTTAFTGKTTGAMTYSFIQAIQNEPGLTYGRLLHSMRKQIREAKTGLRLNGPIANLINKTIFKADSQEPQLSSSEKFNIYTKKFIL